MHCTWSSTNMLQALDLWKVLLPHSHSRWSWNEVISPHVLNKPIICNGTWFANGCWLSTHGNFVSALFLIQVKMRLKYSGIKYNTLRDVSYLPSMGTLKWQLALWKRLNQGFTLLQCQRITKFYCTCECIKKVIMKAFQSHFNSWSWSLKLKYV